MVRFSKAEGMNLKDNSGRSFLNTVNSPRLNILIGIFAIPLTFMLMKSSLTPKLYFPFESSFLLYFSLILLIGIFSRIRPTEEHLMIDYDTIPWSNVDHIILKESQLGNWYLAVYFKDDTPPNGFEVGFLTDKKELIRCLRYAAEKKGFTFTSEVDLGAEEQLEIGETSPLVQERQKTEITLSPLQKSFLIVFLALVSFTAIYLLLGIRIAVSLFVIILIHEGGHLAALKFFHLKVHGLFFIPLIGAGVIPKDGLPSPGVEAAVALAGPLAALSLNGIGHLLLGNLPSLILEIHLLMITIPLNFAINILNLLPILPLDGGRIVRAALLRGRKSLIPVSAITIGTGLILGIFFKDLILMVFVMIGLASLIGSYKKMEKKEIAPPSWWKSCIILAAWVALIYLYWATLPPLSKMIIRAFGEIIF